MEQKGLIRYHKTAEQCAEVVAAYKQSGLSLNQFADEHQIPRTTLLGWVKGRARSSEVRVAELIEVANPLAGSGSPASSARHRLHFGSGLILEIHPQFDPSELRKLIQLIQSV